MTNLQPDYGSQFIEFVQSFNDEKGRKIYLQQVKEIAVSYKISMTVNFSDLISYNLDLAQNILNNPKEIIPILERNLHEYVLENALTLDPTLKPSIPRVHIRFVNLPTSLELRKLKNDVANKLISVEGIVVKTSLPLRRVVKATFRHEYVDCMQQFEYPLEGEFGEVIEIPTLCPVCGKAGQFKMIDEKSKMIDYQRVVLQERPEELPPGQLPRPLELVLEDDLVDTVRPGDRIKVVGIYELKKDSLIRRGSSSVFNSFMKVNSIEISQKALDEVKISEDDEMRIKELSKDQWIIERIISSIAPSIYGRFEIKEAIAIALFGGVPKVLEDGTRVRGDPNILIIGDPGVAKSQLLDFAYRIAPRAIKTTGKGSTAAGLTATVTRDKNSGEYYLEAGALVLADGGVAIIDEFDKMREEDRRAIHEAMEQQTVSIAKAGIVAKLNSRTTIIAAGNPKLGRYIDERPVADNIDLPPSIMSRFDLIFILKDRPSEEDQLLASHILDAHAGSLNKVNIIEIDLLKKYIAYARKNVTPKLSEEAKVLLQDFFVEMRKKSNETPDSPIIITPRQLEALIRIAEAYAKMRLGEYVTKEDAERAINIMRTFLETTGIDIETGKMDVDTIMTGKSKGTRDKIERVLEIIDTLAGKTGCANEKDIIREAQTLGFDKATIEKLLENMRKEGLIYESRIKCYRKV